MVRRGTSKEAVATSDIKRGRKGLALTTTIINGEDDATARDLLA
jgi:hypothetical protein